MYSIYTIDRKIEADPLIERVRLCKLESEVFRKILPQLYAQGAILVDPKLGGNEYLYRRVIVELTDDQPNLLLG